MTTCDVITHLFRSRFPQIHRYAHIPAWHLRAHLLSGMVSSKALKVRDEDFRDDEKIGRNQKTVFIPEHLVSGHECSFLNSR